MSSIEFFGFFQNLRKPALLACAAMIGLGCNFVIGAGEPEAVQAPNDGTQDGEGGGEPTPPCGNGLLDEGEACDDGNTIEGDGCHNCAVDCGNSMLGEFKELASKHCYRIVETPELNWDGAELECEAWGGTLAAPTSLDEYGFIQNRIRKSTWLGGRKEHLDGAYQWVTGEEFWTPDMSFPPEAPMVDYPCVMIGGDYLNYEGRACEEVHAFVCEKGE